ncbi:MAG: type II secretion system F family protein [Bdellovibrionota bacterium]
MPDYKFEGVDKSGKRTSGSIEASGEGELRMVLRSRGIRPVRIVKSGGMATSLALRVKGQKIRGVGITELVVFTRQLQVLINSGIPLMQSLEILHEQSVHKSFKKVLEGMKERVSQGSYLWEAISAYPTVFSKLYIALIRAGESSGALDNMLKRLSRYIEDEDRLRKMVKSMMMYPAIVTLIGVGVVSFILIVVIPKFEEMFKGSGQSLPAPTKMVIGAAHFMGDNALLLIGSAVLLGIMFLKFIKTNEGRALTDKIFFRAPLFGVLMQKAGVARFCRTMQTLLTSGVNLIDAIDICKATIDNAVIEESVAGIKASVESGQTFGTALAKKSVFPKMAFQMIQIGESTGNLDKMLEKIADFYEADVESLVSGMSKLIEPLIMVFLGGVIGALMIAMYLPIFKLAGGGGE